MRWFSNKFKDPPDSVSGLSNEILVPYEHVSLAGIAPENAKCQIGPDPLQRTLGRMHCGHPANSGVGMRFANLVRIGATTRVTDQVHDIRNADTGELQEIGVGWPFRGVNDHSGACDAADCLIQFLGQLQMRFERSLEEPPERRVCQKPEMAKSRPARPITAGSMEIKAVRAHAESLSENPIPNATILEDTATTAKAIGASVPDSRKLADGKKTFQLS
jgi:hypothetical protein